MGLFTGLRKPVNCISAIADGKVIRLENISDQAFANQMVGDGIALELNTRTIYSPCEGIVSMIAPTGHAFAITTANGAEVLVHIGLKHNLSKQHFNYYVNVNDAVDNTMPIVSLTEDAEALIENSLIVVIIVLNYQQHPIQTRTTAMNISRGKKLFTCR